MFIINLVRLPVSSNLKTRLFAPLYTSLVLLLFLILGQQALNVWLASLCKQLTNQVNHTFLVKNETDRLLNLIIDQKRDIPENQNNQQLFNSSLNRLKTLAINNSTQLEQIARISNIHIQWESQLSAKERPDSKGQYTSETALFNSLRTQINILFEQEKKLLSDRESHLQQLHLINIIVNVLGTVGILLGIYLNHKFLYQRIKVPLRKLTEVGKAWQTGQMEARLAYSSADEIGVLGKTLNTMASNFSKRQECVEVRNQRLEDIMYGISHDLRTPLLAVRMTINSVLGGAFGPLSDTCKEVFQEYRQTNEDLLKLLEALLNISRYETGNKDHVCYEPLDWERIFVKTIAIAKATSEQEFTINYKISELLPTIYGDELEIQRVMQNLLDNAVRVSEANKKIVLEVMLLDENTVKVCVQDQGRGISLQEQQKLFQRFVQGRGPRGKSGLGLYLCRRIIEAHGGSIGVESSLGEGSTFWFTLPVNADKARSQDEQM